MTPTEDADREAAYRADRRKDDEERARTDAQMKREVGVLEATVRAMWDLLGGKEEESDDAHLPHAR